VKSRTYKCNEVAALNFMVHQVLPSGGIAMFVFLCLGSTVGD